MLCKGSRPITRSRPSLKPKGWTPSMRGCLLGKTLLPRLSLKLRKRLRLLKHPPRHQHKPTHERHITSVDDIYCARMDGTPFPNSAASCVWFFNFFLLQIINK